MYILTIKDIKKNDYSEVRKKIWKAINSIEFDGGIEILRGNRFPINVEGSMGNGETLKHYLTEEFKEKGLIVEKIEF